MAVSAKAANRWLKALPRSAGGRQVLTLESARHLALVSPTAWCIGPYGGRYAIGKQTAYPEWNLYYIVGDGNAPLAFDSIDAAAHFMRTQLHIHQAVVTLIPGLFRAAP